MEEGIGVISLDHPEPVRPSTPFRVASITKLFTAAAVMKLVDRGELNLDTPVDSIFSWFSPRRPAGIGSRPIIVRHLLTHTSGLPRDSRLTDFSRMYQPSPEDAISAFPEEVLRSPPGERYAYSNLGYGVLGQIVAHVSGRSFDAFLEKEIFDSLGMWNTLVHPSPEDEITRGHGPIGPDGVRRPAGFWDLGFATPAGGIAASVEELAEFVKSQLSPYTGAGKTVLSNKSIRAMHDVQHLMDFERGGSGLGRGVEISGNQIHGIGLH